MTLQGLLAPVLECSLEQSVVEQTLVTLQALLAPVLEWSLEQSVVEQALVTLQALLAPVLEWSLEQSVRLGGLLLLQSWRLEVDLMVHLPLVLALTLLELVELTVLVSVLVTCRPALVHALELTFSTVWQRMESLRDVPTATLRRETPTAVSHWCWRSLQSPCSGCWR